MLAAQNPLTVVLWCAVLMAAVFVLGGLTWIVRRWMLGTGGAGGGDVWSLQQLRELRASGQITEEEFQRLRAEMLGRHGAKQPPGGETDENGIKGAGRERR